MPRPSYSAIIPAPIDHVWPVFRDFAGLSKWHPAVKDSTLFRGASGAEVAAQRQFTLVQGMPGEQVREQLLALDDVEHTLVFEVVEGPFPVRDYVSTQRVTEITDGTSTLVEWSATFDVVDADPDEVSRAVTDVFFIGGLKALQAQFAREDSATSA